MYILPVVVNSFNVSSQIKSVLPVRIFATSPNPICVAVNIGGALAGFSNSHRVLAKLYSTIHTANAAGMSPANNGEPPCLTMVCAASPSGENVGVVVALAAVATKAQSCLSVKVNAGE